MAQQSVRISFRTFGRVSTRYKGNDRRL